MEKSSLTALVRQHLVVAREASSAGRRLDEHENPGEATVHVLHGRVRLSSGDLGWEGSAGDLIVVPDARHALEALEDSAVLLTVAKHH
jgi:quercetin dioxygenase-like cupin family protein